MENLKEERIDGKIIATNWNKKIKINDNGDYILLNIGDCTLINRISCLFKEIVDISNNVADEINKSDITNNEIIDILISKQQSVANKMNEFFGDNICMKIFGTDTPYIDDILDVLTQISELIEKFTSQKLKSIEKIKDKFIVKQNARKKI